jgi:hypothetical protein
MDQFPEEPPEPGTTVGPIDLHGSHYLIRGIEQGLWLIDGPVGIQTEVRELDDGTFTMLRTDGKTNNEGTGDTWEEIVAQYF